MNRRDLMIWSGLSAISPSWARDFDGKSELGDFNFYIAKAVEKIRDERAGGGYGGPGEKDLSYTFTRDLHYGTEQIVPQAPLTEKRNPNFKNATMCVAGMAEVIIEAINIYMISSELIRNVDAYKILPLRNWTSSRITSLKSYIFMHADVHNILQHDRKTVPMCRIEQIDRTIRTYPSVSRGTAHAFAQFNMGEERPFTELKRGDFINLNRNFGPGHAVVFWSYIRHREGKFTHEAMWSPDSVGFEYFSAQGPKYPRKGGGFAFRDAIFYGKPRGSAGNVLDPGEIVPQRGATTEKAQLMLNSGRLWSPDRWRTGEAVDRISALMRARTIGPNALRDTSFTQLETEELVGSVDLTTGDEG